MVVDSIPTRKVLTIFLASPSDLGPEREIAREVVDSINRVIARRLRWQIDLLGWEDTLPGYSRPQAKINSDVEACDLFVGIVWKRWGTSSGDGYTSGFEEEYTLATQRRASTTSPEIWLFLRSIQKSDLEDPGEQLTRLLAFRKQVEQEKTVLYKQFDTTESWKDLFRECLTAYLLDLSSSGEEATATEQAKLTRAVEAGPTPLPLGQPNQESDKPVELQQLSSVLESFRRDSVNNGPSFALGDPISMFQVARLALFSAAWFYKYSSEILSVRISNLAFEYKNDLKPLVSERWLLLRATVGGENRPGWYWHSHFTDEQLGTTLGELATSDPNSAVRAGAISLLTRQSVLPTLSRDDLDSFLDAIVNDEDSDVRRAAFEYLGTVGDSTAITLLQTREDDGAEIAALRIATRINPSEAVQKILELPSIKETVVSELERQIGRVEAPALARMLNSKLGKPRMLGARELGRRDALSEDQENTLLADDDLAVRRTIFSILVNKGRMFDLTTIYEKTKKEGGSSFSIFSRPGGPDTDDIILSRLRHMNREDLEGCLKTVSIYTYLAYRVLAEDHFSEFGSRVRADLQSGFQSVFESHEQTIRNLLGPEDADKFLEITSGTHEDFFQRELTAAALWGLAKNGEEADRAFARQFIASEHSELVGPSIEILGWHGAAEDTTTLIQVASQGPLDLRSSAASAAIKLRPGPNGAALEILATEKPKLVCVVLKRWMSERVVGVRDRVAELLGSEYLGTRLAALAFLVRTEDRGTQISILDQYIQRETYYYNVVAWFDRVLFAPETARAAFRRMLLEEAGLPEEES